MLMVDILVGRCDSPPHEFACRARVNGNARGEGSVTRFDVLQDANCSLSCVLSPRSMISDK